MEDWKHLVRNSVNTPEKLAAIFDVDLEEMRRVHEVFPIRINPYYLSLIEKPGAIPSGSRLFPIRKSLSERVLKRTIRSMKRTIVKSPMLRIDIRTARWFYVNYMCPIYCRFCTRKRKVGDPDSIPDGSIEMGLRYLREHAEVRDVNYFRRRSTHVN